jgi:hypothetical protein
MREWKYNSTIIDLSIRLRWEVSFTLRLIYLRGESPLFPLDRSLGGRKNRVISDMKIVDGGTLHPQYAFILCISCREGMGTHGHVSTVFHWTGPAAEHAYSLSNYICTSLFMDCSHSELTWLKLWTLKTVSGSPRTEDQPVARPLSTQNNMNTEKRRDIHTSSWIR